MKIVSYVLTASLLAVPGVALAANYGSAGCGLGSLVFEPSDEFVQVFAATTNTTSASQIFGITSGTSNCAPEEESASLDQKAFIHHNYANVVRDAARGNGEYLAAFATLLGCSQPVHANFFDYAQGQSNLFDAEAQPLEVLQSVKSDLAKDAVLGAQCSRI
jgi:hypothetical protein